MTSTAWRALETEFFQKFIRRSATTICRQLQLRFVEPGKPQLNAYIGNFNGKFRDECLNAHWFQSMRHARQVIAEWCEEYKRERPQSSLGYLTPRQFADSFLTADFLPVSY